MRERQLLFGTVYGKPGHSCHRKTAPGDVAPVPGEVLDQLGEYRAAADTG